MKTCPSKLGSRSSPDAGSASDLELNVSLNPPSLSYFVIAAKPTKLWSLPGLLIFIRTKPLNREES